MSCMTLPFLYSQWSLSVPTCIPGHQPGLGNHNVAQELPCCVFGLMCSTHVLDSTLEGHQALSLHVHVNLLQSTTLEP